MAISFLGVRIDIDTLRDARMLPATLELLTKYNIRASFFVTTGVDETYRNFKHYTPWKLLSGNAIRRFGLNMFSGLLTKKEVQQSKELPKILDNGHELGLHGYQHFDWMNNLDGKRREELAVMIGKGCELFEKAFGYHPECFAAPGFKTSSNFLEAIDDFGFRYSSDFMGEKTFYPAINGVKLKTLQIPMSLAIEEHDDNVALKLLKEHISKGYAVFYFHPSYEPIFKRSILEKALDCVGERIVPLGELIR